jgi:predicted outer membrane protein
MHHSFKPVRAALGAVLLAACGGANDSAGAPVGSR